VQYAARLLGGDIERARDAVQDVFLRLCQRQRAEPPARPAEWLFAVTRNAAFDVRRREKKMEPMDPATMPRETERPGPAEVAAQNPQVEFVIVDQCIDQPPANVRCAVFREFEASFLIGAMAASLSASGHVGVIGTADIPFLRRYTEGFEAGARHVREDIEISVRWVGGENPFADPVRAKEQALDLVAAGADHLFAAAAAGNLGIFEAARERDVRAFGLDVDQCPAAPGFIVDNLLKRVDRVIEQVTDAVLAGNAPSTMVFGLGTGGLDVGALRPESAADSDCLIFDHPDVMATVQKLAEQIVAGEIGIEDPMGLL
jgi:basic membrane protein A